MLPAGNSKQYKASLQAALYYMRKKNRERRIAAATPTVDPVAAAQAVFAKYAPNNVHVFLPNTALYKDAGVTLAASGDKVAFAKDSQGTSNLTQTTVASQPSALKVGSIWSLHFIEGTSQALLKAAQMFDPNADHAVIAGIDWSNGTADGISVLSGASGSNFSKAGILQPRGSSASDYAMCGRWTNNGGPDFDVVATIADATKAAVYTTRKVGSVGSLRINSAVKGTVDLTTFNIAANLSGIGSGIETGQDSFTGNIYPVIFVAGSITDADLATLERYVKMFIPVGAVAPQQPNDFGSLGDANTQSFDYGNVSDAPTQFTDYGTLS